MIVRIGVHVGTPHFAVTGAMRPSTASSRPTAQSISSRVITSGGASRMTRSCVSLQSIPSRMSASQYGRAGPFISTPIHSPRPRISRTSGRLRSLQLSQEVVPELGGPLDEPLVDDDAQRRARDGAGERISAERAAVIARVEDAEHLARGEHGGDRIEPARERLADDDRVGRDALVLVREQLARSPEARLDLVGDEQHALLAADLGRPPVRNPAGGTMMPASPWIGSTRNAHVFGVMAARSASASPYGITRKPGVSGPKPERYCSSVEKLMIEMVRPWKLFRQAMISAWPSGMPLTV